MSYRNSSSRSQRQVGYSNILKIRGFDDDVTVDTIDRALARVGCCNFAHIDVSTETDSDGHIKNIALIHFDCYEVARRFKRNQEGELKLRGDYYRLYFHTEDPATVPSPVIELNPLALDITEKEIVDMLNATLACFVSVRIQRNPASGLSRGYGFVDFSSVEDARRWMEAQKGVLNILGKDVYLSYAAPLPRDRSTSNPTPTQVLTDWICSRCSVHNFKRRDVCFRCTLPRSQSLALSANPPIIVTSSEDGSEFVGTNPCNTLVIRNLDALTVEEEITNRLQIEYEVTLKNCTVMRDEQTHVSRCFALVELPNVADAYKIIEHLKQKSYFEIHGKAVEIKYSKNTYTTIMSTLKMQGSVNAKPASSFGPRTVSAQSTADALNIAQNALKSRLVQRSSAQAPISLPVPTLPFNFATFSTTLYPMPDHSTFLLDPSTNYHYDPFTGLLYEPNSKYYYDRVSQKYFHYDMATAYYIPAEQYLAQMTATSTNNLIKSSAVAATMEEALEPTKPLSVEEKRKEKEKEKTNKTAKQIARDMEKWAKRMNCTQKESQNTSHVVSIKAQVQDSPPQAANAVFDIMFSKESDTSNPNNNDYPKEIVSQYEEVDAIPFKNPATVSNNQIKDLESLVQEEEQKGFKDVETLQKHREMSQLHNTNYNNLRAKHNLRPVPLGSFSLPSQLEPYHGTSEYNKPYDTFEQSNYQYRDRAKERRSKFGVSPPKNERKREHSPETNNDLSPANNHSDGPSDIGSRLMTKMGWQTGQGLGRTNQGRTDLVEAEFREAGVGLGVKNSRRSGPRTAGDYRENAKLAMFARYYDS